VRALAVTNGLWNALANAFSTLLAIAGSILIVRSLTPAEYGSFSYFVWLATIISVLGTLAFPLAITKITSELRGDQRPADAYALSRLLTVALIVINLIIAVGVLFLAVGSTAPQNVYLLIIAAYLVPNALTAHLRSTLWGHERYRPVAAIEIGGSLVQIVLVVGAYQLDLGAPGYVAAVLSGNVIQAVGLAALMWRPPRPRRLPSFPERALVRRYLAFASPATLILLCEVIIWQRSEIFFLELLRDLAEVGYYNLSFTVFSMFLALGWALLHGFYPAISRSYGAKQWHGIHHNVRQSAVLAALFAVPLTFGGWTVVDKLVLLLYGEKMLPVVPVAQILLVGLMPGVLAGIFSLTVNAVGGIWLLVRLGIPLVALNVVLNILLVPAMGAVGGAIANTGTQVAYTFMLILIVSQRYRIALPYRAVGGVVLIGALTTFALPTVLQGWLPGVVGLLAAAAAAGCVYLIAIWSMGYLKFFRSAEATP